MKGQIFAFSIVRIAIIDNPRRKIPLPVGPGSTHPPQSLLKIDSFCSCTTTQTGTIRQQGISIGVTG